MGFAPGSLFQPELLVIVQLAQRHLAGSGVGECGLSARGVHVGSTQALGNGAVLSWEEVSAGSAKLLAPSWSFPALNPTLGVCCRLRVQNAEMV